MAGRAPRAATGIWASASTRAPAGTTGPYAAGKSHDMKQLRPARPNAFAGVAAAGLAGALRGTRPRHGIEAGRGVEAWQIGV